MNKPTLSRRHGLFVLLALLVPGMIACGGRDGGSGAADEATRIEELLESGPAPLDVELASVDGERDGAQSRAVFLFGGHSTELRLELVLAYDPQPVLSWGEWSYRGPTGTGEGTVRAESVRFVGGQGEGVSIGGVYVLEENGHSRFRVRLPLTSIAPSWSPQGD